MRTETSILHKWYTTDKSTTTQPKRWPCVSSAACLSLSRRLRRARPMLLCWTTSAYPRRASRIPSVLTRLALIELWCSPLHNKDLTSLGSRNSREALSCQPLALRGSARLAGDGCFEGWWISGESRFFNTHLVKLLRAWGGVRWSCRYRRPDGHPAAAY